MSSFTETEEILTIGQQFIDALIKQDFNHFRMLFSPQIRFRALVPRRICEGKSADEAIDWLHRWFGDADEIQVQRFNSEKVFDRLYLTYRLSVHDVINGWRVIEQQMYGTVQNNLISDLWLICTGFHSKES